MAYCFAEISSKGKTFYVVKHFPQLGHYSALM